MPLTIIRIPITRPLISLWHRRAVILRPLLQTGNIQNYGLELALGYNNTWGDFSWNSSLTYTMNRNKVKRLASGATNPITGEIIDMPELRMAVLGADGYAPELY
mgnify:CR=1 FL=1